MLSTRDFELELLKLVSWSLSAFFLIKTSTKENPHQTSKVLTWFAKYYLEVLWSCRRWMAPHDQNRSTQMLSRDIMCNVLVCVPVIYLQLFYFACIVWFKSYPLCNELRLSCILKKVYIGGVCRPRSTHISLLIFFCI